MTAAMESKAPPTVDEIRGWGATTDLANAARAFGLGRNRAYELARAEQFPVRVIRVGRGYRVPVADILARIDPSSADSKASVHLLPAPREASAEVLIESVRDLELAELHRLRDAVVTAIAIRSEAR